MILVFVKIYKKLIASNYWAKGLGCVRKGEYANALAFISKCEAILKYDVEVKLMMGFLYYSLRQDELGFVKLKEALELLDNKDKYNSDEKIHLTLYAIELSEIGERCLIEDYSIDKKFDHHNVSRTLKNMFPVNLYE